MGGLKVEPVNDIPVMGHQEPPKMLIPWALQQQFRAVEVDHVSVLQQRPHAGTMPSGVLQGGFTQNSRGAGGWGSGRGHILLFLGVVASITFMGAAGH